MTAKGIPSSFGLLVAMVLAISHPTRAEDVDPEYRELIRRGNSQIRTARTMMWTGVALFPVSALAAIPVLYDGAFGITAADPGFAAFFALAGGGLIHAGIPVYGSGASKLEKAAGGGAVGVPDSVASGWSHYRRSWKFLIAGPAVLVTAAPFAAAAALRMASEPGPLEYSVWAMGVTGLGLLAYGILEQQYSLYRFAKAAGHARARLPAKPQVSLHPLLLLDRQGPGAGMRLACSF